MLDSPRLCVFDCDGTLVDSQHAIVASMGATFKEHGLIAPSSERVRRVVGLPLKEAVSRLHPEGGDELHDTLTQGYRDAFFVLRGEGRVDEPLYPGAVEVLNGLARDGWVLSIATGKGLRGLILTLDAHGITDRFVTLQTPDTAQGKPSPDMVFKAMSETGARPQDTVVVGDTTFDMEMARAGGVHAVGVAWGYHQPEELIDAGAVTVAEAYADLPATLEGLVPAR